MTGLADSFDRLAESCALNAVVRRPAESKACPNCGRAKDYIGMCGPCFTQFSATEGAWPVWEQVVAKWRQGLPAL